MRRVFAVEDAGVITIEMVMLAALGFLTAALLALFLSPLYRRRVARLTTDMLKRSMPLTEAEIRADKDRLRAEYAIRIHKLETKVEEATEAAARQMVELNRRDAAISEPRGRGLPASAPRSRSTRTRAACSSRRSWTACPRSSTGWRRRASCCSSATARSSRLSQSSDKQARALEEATQINTQQTDEVHRLKAALNTRAARNREGLGDPRFDGEVALRTEIEALRAKTRDQTALIARLQALLVRAGPAAEAADAMRRGEQRRARGRCGPAKVVGRRKGAAAEGAPPLKAVDSGVAEGAPIRRRRPSCAA